MSRGYFPGPNSLDVRIEQAAARGETPGQISDRLAVELVRVEVVLARMDAAAREADLAVELVGRPMDLSPKGRRLQPCGSHAAYTRHKKRGETVCGACEAGERAYQAAQHQRQQAAKAEMHDWMAEHGYLQRVSA